MSEQTTALARAPSGVAVALACIECGAEFRLKASAVRKGKGRFCSRPCAVAWRSRLVLTVDHVASRFWPKVDRSAGDASCWPWTACIGEGGYGQFNVEGRRPIHASRMSWMLHNAATPIPGIDVCHACDNRVCCNPAHLFLGTRRDNMQDAARKNRMPRGESHSCATISDRQAREIKALLTTAMPHAEIAERVGCVVSTVRNIASGRAWRHVQ